MFILARNSRSSSRGLFPVDPIKFFRNIGSQRFNNDSKFLVGRTLEQFTTMPVIPIAMASVTLKWYQYWKLIHKAQTWVSDITDSVFLLPIQVSCKDESTGAVPGGDHLSKDT